MVGRLGEWSDGCIDDDPSTGGRCPGDLFYTTLGNQSHHSLCLTHFLGTINACKY